MYERHIDSQAMKHLKLDFQPRIESEMKRGITRLRFYFILFNSVYDTTLFKIFE
jgi:hypothetical protein